MESNRNVSRLRRIARVWSVVIVILVLFILVAEVVSPHVDEDVEVPLIEWAMLALQIGMIPLSALIAWRWESLGGGITVSSALIAMVLALIARGLSREFLVIVVLTLLLSAPGILFLLSAYLSRGSGQAAAPA